MYAMMSSKEYLRRQEVAQLPRARPARPRAKARGSAHPDRDSKAPDRVAVAGTGAGRELQGGNRGDLRMAADGQGAGVREGVERKMLVAY